MERSQVQERRGSLKPNGMRSARDEIRATGIKLHVGPPRIVWDLSRPEIAEKRARSIRLHRSLATLPLATDLDDFDFAGTKVNEGLECECATEPSWPVSPM